MITSRAPTRVVGAAGDNGGVSNTAVSELACGAAGVARVRFGAPPVPAARPGRAPAPPNGAGGPPGEAAGHLDAALGQVTEYFTGQRRAFDLPVDWSGMSAAQRRVLPVLLASATYGETVTYGALARRSGLADQGKVPAARVTGQIMGSNPCPIIVPCHRVVASDGLGGYSGGDGVEIKRWL